MAETNTAHAMIDMLRRHYLPESKQPGGIFAPEIQAPASSRRADLIWQGVTSGGGYELIGHEVKVTRADLLAELDDPTKSDAWMRYCDRWYLVLPSLTLMEGLDPATWGVMTPPSGRRTRSMTVALKAPALKPGEQGPALRTIATWLHWRLHHEQVERAQEKRYHERDRDELAELRRMVPNQQMSRQLLAEEELVQKIVASVGFDGVHLGDWRHRIEVDDVVTALKGLAHLREAEKDVASQLRYRIRDLQRLRGSIDHVLQEHETHTAAAKPGGG